MSRLVHEGAHQRHTAAFLQTHRVFGDIEVEVLGENVVVNFTPTQAKDEELPNLLQETLEAIEQAKNCLLYTSPSPRD